MISFYLFLTFEKFLMLLPKKFRKLIFIFIALIAYKFSIRYKKVVRQNVLFIYGNDVSEEFIQKITKYSFKLLSLNFLHTLESNYYSVQEISKKITFINEGVVKKAQEAKRPIVFITSHYGAWELGGAMISALLEPVMIVYKPMKNKYFEKYLLESREKWRIKYVQRRGATKGLLKQLKSGGAIALLIDTNVGKKDGIVVEFLGKEVTQIKTTAFFARKFDAVIIPVLIHTKDDTNYTIEFSDEIIPPKSDDSEADILESVKMQTDWLSKEILKEPGPWFWLHRRFKTDYPQVYKD